MCAIISWPSGDRLLRGAVGCMKSAVELRCRTWAQGCQSIWARAQTHATAYARDHTHTHTHTGTRPALFPSPGQHQWPARNNAFAAQQPSSLAVPIAQSHIPWFALALKLRHVLFFGFLLLLLLVFCRLKRAFRTCLRRTRELQGIGTRYDTHQYAR